MIPARSFSFWKEFEFVKKKVKVQSVIPTNVVAFALSLERKVCKNWMVFQNEAHIAFFI